MAPYIARRALLAATFELSWSGRCDNCELRRETFRGNWLKSLGQYKIGPQRCCHRLHVWRIGRQWFYLFRDLFRRYKTLIGFDSSFLWKTWDKIISKGCVDVHVVVPKCKVLIPKERVKTQSHAWSRCVNVKQPQWRQLFNTRKRECDKAACRIQSIWTFSAEPPAGNLRIRSASWSQKKLGTVY